MTNQEAIQAIIDELGLTEDRAMSEFFMESVVPGICTECGAMEDRLEPDACNYKCAYCGQNTVQSILTLLGV